MNDQQPTETDQQPIETESTEHEHHDELHELKQFLKVHGPRWLTGICIALIIVTGVNLYRKNAAKKIHEASIQLARATTLPELETVVEQFPKTPTAPIATLKLAKACYASGNYDRASRLYADFLGDFPEHMLAPIAEMGDHQCKEATGQLEDALKGFEKFKEAYPDHFLVTEASLGKARCLHQLGRLEDAKIAYETIVADNQNSEATARAETWLKKVEREIEQPATVIDAGPQVFVPAATAVEVAPPVEPEPVAAVEAVPAETPAEPEAVEVPKAPEPEAKEKAEVEKKAAVTPATVD